MRVRDRLYIGFIAVMSSIIASQFAAFESNKPKGVQFEFVKLASDAKAQEKAPDKASPDKAVPDKNPPKGMEDLKKNAQAFKRGAKPTPAHKIFAAPKYHPAGIKALPNVAYVPKKLSMWGNSTYGDCVSADEAYNQAVCGVFLDDSTVTNWASKNGYLNGADLLEVMQSMNKSGMQQGGHTYGVGANPVTVDFSNEGTLQSALSIGPVKIGIDANALPSGAGNQQGWYTLAHGTYRNEDHCVGLGGYGTADYLFKQLNVQLPAALTPTQPGYLLFTWSTLGFITHDWLMGTCSEAWLRNPCQMIDNQPQPNPGPSATPPVINSALTAAGVVGAAFSYQISATNSPTSFAAMPLPTGLTVSPVGLISGTPTTAGTASVTISATNSSGTGNATLVVTVTAAPTPNPNPTPDPSPSGIKVPLSAAQVLGLQRDPTNTFEPTVAQVQQIINGAGMEIITGSMTATDFFAAINRATARKTKYAPPPSKPSAMDVMEGKIERLEKTLIEFMKKETK